MPPLWWPSRDSFSFLYASWAFFVFRISDLPFLTANIFTVFNVIGDVVVPLLCCVDIREPHTDVCSSPMPTHLTIHSA